MPFAGAYSSGGNSFWARPKAVPDYDPVVFKQELKEHFQENDKVIQELFQLIENDEKARSKETYQLLFNTLYSNAGYYSLLVKWTYSLNDAWHWDCQMKQSIPKRVADLSERNLFFYTFRDATNGKNNHASNNRLPVSDEKSDEHYKEYNYCHVTNGML